MFFFSKIALCVKEDLLFSPGFSIPDIAMDDGASVLWTILRNCFLSFQDGSLFNRVFKTYSVMHTNQTVDFVQQKVKQTGANSNN